MEGLQNCLKLRAKALPEKAEAAIGHWLTISVHRRAARTF
jgi:hypothetical protein